MDPEFGAWVHDLDRLELLDPTTEVLSPLRRDPPQIVLIETTGRAARRGRGQGFSIGRGPGWRRVEPGREDRPDVARRALGSEVTLVWADEASASLSTPTTARRTVAAGKAASGPAPRHGADRPRQGLLIDPRRRPPRGSHRRSSRSRCRPANADRRGRPGRPTGRASSSWGPTSWVRRVLRTRQPRDRDAEPRRRADLESLTDRFPCRLPRTPTRPADGPTRADP